MAGARLEDERLHYPVSELAARYGASVEEETTDFAHVYPRFEPSRRERPSYWTSFPGPSCTLTALAQVTFPNAGACQAGRA
jgi:hypothetical protein